MSVLGKIKSKIRRSRDLDLFSKQVAEESGWPVSKAKEELEKARTLHKIQYKDYLERQLWTQTDVGIARIGLRLNRGKKKNSDAYARMIEATGLDTKTLMTRRLEIKSWTEEISVTARKYMGLGLYNYDPAKDKDEIWKILNKGIRQAQIRDEARELIDRAYAGEISYDEVKPLMEEYKAIDEEVLSPLSIDFLMEFVEDSHPEYAEASEEERRELAFDMNFCRNVMRYNPSEFVSFDFFNKDIAEREKFVCDAFRGKRLKGMNSTHADDTLNSKYDAYLELKPYYGREMERILSMDDFDKFEAFVKRHPSFVKKGNFDSLGRGIEPVYTDENTDLKSLLEELLRDDGIIVEEMIQPHEDFKFLNPDSVNTIRCITIKHDGIIEILGCSLKIGHKGSFIDNAGAGGLLAHIDKETGIIDSTGVDKKGIRYEKNPDYGYVIKGYQLPNWEKAKEIALAAAASIDGLVFCGWDLTCNSDGEWIIVEGNAKSQFFGMQATLNKGIKAEFLEMMKNVEPAEPVEEGNDDGEC